MSLWRITIMITIKSGNTVVTIAKKGAEIKSIISGGKEYMWEANPDIWGQSAPIMFPMCGGLKQGRYELFGESYEMIKHGFAKISTFEVESISENRATMLLRDNEQTRAMYPYSFEFRVTFELSGNSLSVTYDAKNLDEKVMYCTFGAHEAYACPEGIEEYEVVFPECETLYASGLNGDIVTDYTKLIVDNSNRLVLRDIDFFLDALVFRGLKSRTAELVSKNGSRRVKIDFEGFDYFVLWHKYGAPYLCLEPWCGLPDVTGSTYDFREKVGMHALATGEHFTRTHTITIA